MRIFREFPILYHKAVLPGKPQSPALLVENIAWDDVFAAGFLRAESLSGAVFGTVCAALGLVGSVTEGGGYDGEGREAERGKDRGESGDCGSGGDEGGRHGGGGMSYLNGRVEWCTADEVEEG